MEHQEYKEQIIRKVTEIGNGAHIFAPREWLDEEVLIVRLKKSIKEEIIKLAYPHLDKIIAVFLYGSHARNEQTEKSDVDVVVISKEPFELKKENFDIVVIPENKIKKAIELNPILLYSVINEAKPIINGNYLEILKREKIELKYFKNYIEETKRLIKINKSEISLYGGKEIAPNSVIYSLMLRLRGIFIIDKLMKKEKFSNLEFKSWIIKNSEADYEKVYKIYSSLRDDKKEKNIVPIAQAESLLSLLENETKRIENKI